MSNQEKCKHLLPCGYCDVKGAKCEVFYAETKPVAVNDLVHEQCGNESNSAHHICDWEFLSAHHNPITLEYEARYRCRICGKTHTETNN